MLLEAAMWRSLGRRRWRWPRVAWNVFRVAGVLALVLLPILWVADAQFPDHRLFRQMYSWGKNAVGCGAAAAEKQAGVDRAADASPTGEDDASPDLVARRLARSLPGPEPFAAPEVAAALQLTDVQRAKLHELIEATVGALRSIDEKWQKESRQSQARKRNTLLQAARGRPCKSSPPPNAHSGEG